MACGYFAAAALTVWLTRFSGGVAFVWIASALLTSHLCLTPRKDWRPALIACGVASAAATSLFGLGPVAAPFLAVINVAESAIGAVLLRRWIARPGGFESIGEVARFAFATALVAPLATAPFGAAVATAVSSTPFLANAMNWTAGHALGALTFAPLAFLVGRGEIAEWRRGVEARGVIEAFGLSAAMIVVSFAVFAQATLPLLFLPLLPALIATFRVGRLGAVASVLILIAVGAPLSVYGWGPLPLLDGSMGFRIQFFQFYVAVVVLTVMPAAAELQHRRRLFASLQEGEKRYRLLAENTTDVIIWSKPDTTRRYVSPAAKAVLGYDPEELVGTKPLDFVHPDDRARYGETLRSLSAGLVNQAVTRQRYRRKDGSWVWIEASFSSTHDPSTGAATGYVASLRDVTAHRAADDALRMSEERLALALDSGSDGLWDWDVTTGGVQLSDHWFWMLGYEPGDIEPHIRTWDALVHPDDAERARRLLRDHLKGLSPTYECEYRLRTKSGAFAWMLARGKVVTRAGDGRALRVVGTHIDITRRKVAEHQIEHMALHDALTGLPNRVLFRQRLTLSVAEAACEGHALAMLACDLDRFKSVNDTRGHLAGDAVLRAVAERLKSVLRAGDTVARLGGDEFAVILARIDRPEEAARIAARLIDLVGQPIDVDGQLTGVGISVGVALGQGDPAEQIFKNADMALYRAKAAGRNTYRFFEQGMDAALVARSLLEVDLRDAVRRDAFELHYQPVIALGTGEPCGFEALLRWPHPTRGMISPAEFIPLAEETGLILPLGEWALREACREAAGWPRDIRVAVNVSAVQFQRPGLAQSVIDALDMSGLSPDRLELEITESVLMENAEGAVSSLMRLRALGVRIALDDFGTGYSSLSYLRRFPFNKIKIDRSFIAEIEDQETAAIVRAIVGLGRRNGAEITAEGVETDRQLELVRQEGCTEVQGFLFSRPLTSEAATRFISQNPVGGAAPDVRCAPARAAAQA
ncbi:EAL domain-containing protein [Hansschlegelia sp. KR7-227]|uniref:bifunctional diguanylate cyclase/phosphodiesterase n=1 Tax=Hansschlegelia sp. KR7-227 TaxID=3400914 RepID=UPI003C078156